MVIFGFLLTELIFFALIIIGGLFTLKDDKYAAAGVLTAMFLGWLGYKLYKDQLELMSVITLARDWFIAGFFFCFLKWYFYTRKSFRSFSRRFKAWSLDKHHYSNHSASAHVRNIVNATEAVSGDVISDQATLKKLFIELEGKYYSNALFTYLVDEAGNFDFTYDKGKLATKITSWVIWWPFYLLLIVLEDLLTWIFEKIVDSFNWAFGLIAKMARSNLNS